MNSGELYDLFRSDVVDVVATYLWSDTEVFAYMNDAHRQFVRLTGGIPDSTSELTQVPTIIGEPFAEVSPLILKFRTAYLTSTGQAITIINQEDVGTLSVADYGASRNILMDSAQGIVRYMVIGMERSKTAGKVRWMQIPAAADIVQLSVYRLPADTIVEGDMGFEFPEIGDEHVEWLLLWMKARAYGKQDAETFDRGRRDSNRAEFTQYCMAAKAEWEQYKHKTRVVRYGGL